ncbi:T9SS type A sorting domain-containing protein [Olleya marilimosa]|uniref:T9SS type A sorting domain-containing protein n=1 Tax=Olleya marilimosa TaxID=272164 RepID=UPI00168D457B|nr:T9SS type A sorting domain-containing protein [Olleya marilimosa]MBD3891498.1 T9SS type A sorting domain-containing protein [Olleya marilimosa]
MKKIYFLLFTFTSFVALAQTSTTVDFDTAANWTTLGSGYSSQVYEDGVFSFTSTSTLRETSGTQDGFDRTFANSTYAVRLRNNSASSLTFNIASGGVSDFNVKVRRWDSSPSTDFTLEFSIDGTNWTNVATVNDASLLNASDWVTFSGVINDTSDNIKVRFTSNGTTERIMVDNFTWNDASTLSTTSFKQSEFSVFPNPTSNGFVNIKTANNQPVAVVAYDVLGKQVLNTKLTTSRLNVSNLKAGVYILKLTQNGATTTKKLVIE